MKLSGSSPMAWNTHVLQFATFATTTFWVGCGGQEAPSLKTDMAKSITYQVEVTDESATSDDRDTIGGAPQLSTSQPHPRCKLCGEQMVLFLQFDIREEFGLPFKPGSHLLAFMCPQHNDASITSAEKSPLAPAFWDHEDHFSLLLLPPESSAPRAEIDHHIQPRRIRFVKTTEQVDDDGEIKRGMEGFKVGGTPGWINYAPAPKCSCGGSMRFVTQIPENFGFRQTATAPEQPNSFSRSEYCFLLGNAVYIMACDKQCNPRSVIAICDN